MRKFISFVFFIFLFCVVANAATTHYISSSSGSDSNNGTSKSTPWAHAPGMVTCTGNCASYTSVGDDQFIFKGGDTWTYTNFPDTWNWSGSSGHAIYIGVDVTWFSGGSFTRPIFDGGNTPLSPSSDSYFDFRGQDYVVFDNFELTNFGASTYGGAYGTCAPVNIQGVQNATVENLYVHNFHTNGSGPPCYVVQGATYAPFGGNSVFQDSTITGDGTDWMQAIIGVGNLKNNIISGITGMLFPMGHGEVSGNLLYNCGYPSFPAGATNTHADAIQVNGADGIFYIHDNVIHDTGSDSNGNECEAALIGNPSETDYVWNNVLYNIHGNSFALTQNALPGIAAYFWNNSVEGGQDSSGYCFRAGHGGTYSTIEIINNHCISNQSQVNDPALSASTLTVNNNLLQTISSAAANSSPHFDQYSFSQTPYVLFPVASTNSTVGAGANLSGDCSGGTSSLCSDTTYAGARSTNTRTAPWSIGAYQFSSGGVFYTFSVSTIGTGTGSLSGTNCASATYAASTSITCTATPSGGSTFTGWGGTGAASGCTTSTTCTFSLTSSSTLQASFNAPVTPSYTFSRTIIGSGSVSGTNCSNGTYLSGTNINCIGTPSTGYSLSGWSGTGSASGCGSSCVFTLGANSTATVTFTINTYSQTVNTSGSGSLTGTNCSNGIYNYNTSISCTATPSTGYHFTGWSGTGSGASCVSNPCTYNITSNTTLTANFAINTYNFSATTSGSGSGTISGCVNGTYLYNTSISCTATPASGSTFTGWSGTGSASSCTSANPCTFNISSTSVLSAVFNPITPPTPGRSHKKLLWLLGR